MDWPLHDPKFDEDEFEVFQYQQGQTVAVRRSVEDKACNRSVTIYLVPLPLLTLIRLTPS